MLLATMFERFVEKTPVSVMARAAMEHALAPAALDALFEKHTDKRYTRDLLFSSVVDLMGVVVGKVAPSVHAAYQAVADTLPVSIASVYNKLNRMEPDVTGALVRHTAQRGSSRQRGRLETEARVVVCCRPSGWHTHDSQQRALERMFS